jgi:hypothetical protein
MGRTILALDIATKTGYAIGRADQQKPRFGTQDLGRLASDTEDKIAALMRWLLDIIRIEKPDYVVIERAMDPNVAAHRGNRSSTIVETISLAKTAGGVCRLAGIRFEYVDRQKALGFFVGQRTFQEERDPVTGKTIKSREVGKRATVRRCFQLGIEVADDNQADAIALFFYGASQTNPLIGAEALALFAGSKA